MISGRPTAPGTASFTVSVSDAETPPAAVSALLSVSVTVAPLAVTPVSVLPAATLRVPYSVKLAAAGGLTPYTWSIIAGSLIPGLTLHAATGVISGTPLKTGVSTFTAQVSDAENPHVTVPAAFSLATGVPAKATPAISTTPGAGGPVGGTTVTDTAILSGGSSPTGMITFSPYGPSGTADCSGTPVDTEAAAVTGNGSYTTPAGYTPAAAGTYWWTASYGGDGGNTGVSSGCGAEPVHIDPASPDITATPSGGGPAGSTLVTDTAILSGGSSPTGTITFSLYPTYGGVPDCFGLGSPPVDTETVPVTGNGSYATPAGYTPSQPGLYLWNASYSGDAGNAPAASGCAQVIISAPAVTAITTSGGGSVPVDGSGAFLEASLSGGSSPTGTITFDVYGPSATADCSGSPAYTAIGNVDASFNAHASIELTQVGIFWWTASYSGDAGNAPAVSGCGAGKVTASQVPAAITTTPGAGGPVGTTVQDTASVSAQVPQLGGTVTFSLYGPSAAADCSGTAVFDQTVTGSGSGSYTSPSFTPAQAGTYWWTASYSGDADTTPAASGCGTESVTISP